MAPLPPTRISLILRLADPSDLVAWEEFVAIYGPAIYRLILARGLQAADAEDVAQEILLAVARSIERFEHDPRRAKFRTWLGSIARNMVADFFRRRQRLPPTESGAVDLREFPQLPSSNHHASNYLVSNHHTSDGDTSDGDNLWDESQWNEELRTAIFEQAATIVRGRVTSQTWGAFQLTALEQVSAEAAAQSLDMSVGSVYVSRCRVLKAIRKEVSRLLSELDEDRCDHTAATTGNST